MFKTFLSFITFLAFRVTQIQTPHPPTPLLLTAPEQLLVDFLLFYSIVGVHAYGEQNGRWQKVIDF